MAEKRHLVVTVFESEAAAMAAAEWLKKWESMNTDVDVLKFGAVGVLTAGEDREIRSTGWVSAMPKPGRGWASSSVVWSALSPPASDCWAAWRWVRWLAESEGA